MASGYSIVIKAVDNATGVFDALNKRMDALQKRVALARAPFDRLSQSFGKFAKTTGLDKIATGFANVAKGATETFRSMLRVIEPLAAITGAASVAGLYRLAAAWSEFGTKLGQQATRAGLSANALQGLQNAARLAGIDAETLTSGMTTLNDNLRNAAFGGAPQFIQALQALGLSYDDLKNKSPEEALGILANKIAAIKSPTDQALVATAAFGGAAEGMLPFLRRGAAGIEDYRREAESLGRQLGQQGVNDANAFRIAQTRLSLAAEGVAHVLGDKLGVALTPILNQFATWLGTSPKVTAALDAAGDAAGRFAAWLAGIDWAAVGNKINSIADHVQAVVTALGGWETAGLDVLRFMVVVWAAPMLLTIVKIGAALAKIPGQAAAATSAAGGSLGALGGVMAKLGLLGAAWEGTNLLDSATAPSGDGIQNLLHNMLFDMNPMHWTPTYHAGQAGGADSGGTKDIPPGMARDNARDMAAVFKQHGMTDEGAAAMLGSAMGESGDNPDPAHNNEGRGIFQDSPARQADVARLMKKPFAQLTAREQAEGAALELETKPEFAALNRQLHTSHDLSANNQGVVTTFEAPADIPGQTAARAPMSRGALRQIQLDAMNANVAPGGGGGAVVPNVASPAPSGDPASAAPPSGAAGPSGATGKVDMNVKVHGAATVVTKSSGDINIETRNVARDGY